MDRNPGPACSGIVARHGPEYAGYRILGIESGNVSISGVTFANGYTNSEGAAILAINLPGPTTVSISRVTFTGNVAADGAALAMNFGSIVSIDESIFGGNHASFGGLGGAIINDQGVLMVTNSSFLNNAADDDGGAIDIQPGISAIATIINSTFVGNTSGRLGGAIESLGVLSVFDSTFSGNGAPLGGSAITAVRNEGMLANNIFADNPPDAFFPAGDLPGSNNVFYNNNALNDANGYGTSSFVLAQTEPLGELGNNGGPTPTQLPSTGGAAICAGSLPLVPEGMSRDQRGLPRAFGNCVDAGSVQLSQAPPALTPATSLFSALVLGALLALAGLRSTNPRTP